MFSAREKLPEILPDSLERNTAGLSDTRHAFLAIWFKATQFMLKVIELDDLSSLKKHWTFT